jgi:hypothetical protein
MPKVFAKKAKLVDDENYVAAKKKEIIEEVDNCCICMDKISDEKKLDKCGHTFCKGCIESYFKSVKETCPICGTVYGVTKGTQPTGTMQSRRIKNSLPGFEKCAAIEIVYHIPHGIQGVGLVKSIYFLFFLNLYIFLARTSSSWKTVLWYITSRLFTR